MQNSIQVICHRKFGKLRAVVLNGTVYFVGKDAAQALLFKDTDKTIRNRVQPQDKIVFDAKKWGDLKSPHGGAVKIANGAILINESGLWSLVMRSNMPQAQEMQHWLTSEVIPSIMKYGYYSLDEDAEDVKLAELLNKTPETLLNTVISKTQAEIDDAFKVKPLFELLDRTGDLKIRNRLIIKIAEKILGEKLF